MTTTTSSKTRCRLCGDETKVSLGIWKSSKGKYHVIPRCVDHDACSKRAAAL